MKRSLILLSATVLALSYGPVSLAAGMCGAAAADVALAEPGAASFEGTVVATTNASRYTYVQIDTGKQKIWAAGPKMSVKVGDRVCFPAAMPNKNFYSPTLKKNFDELYFVDAITPAKGTCVQGACTNGTCASGTCTTGVCPVGACSNGVWDGIQKPEGGKTIAEIWSAKDTLAGKTVVVQARVVKVIPNIMGKTFVHLRDGTGVEGANDLVVTTTDPVQSKAIVTARGVLVTDKDFGAGYKYDVIMEDAKVTAK